MKQYFIQKKGKEAIKRYPGILCSRGMTTIEACVLIPLSFGILLLLLWTGFYKYDQSVLSEAASLAVRRGSQEVAGSNQEIMKLTEERLDELLQGRLIGIEQVRSDVKVTAGAVAIHLEASFHVPHENIISSLYREEFWQIEIEKSAPRMDPCMLLRMTGKKGE